MSEFARVVLDNFWSFLGSAILLTIFMTGLVNIFIIVRTALDSRRR